MPNAKAHQRLRPPKPANDNASATRKVTFHLPRAVPLALAEVEVFDFLMPDLEKLVANDNVINAPAIEGPHDG